jgi:hypothetical protein
MASTAAGGAGSIATSAGNLYLAAGGANNILLRINGTDKVQINSSAMFPFANDGSALGTTSNGWADLHGATGFTWNIANGNWLATHTSGILTVGTGDLRVTNAGADSASVVTVGGSQTLTNKTLTNPTISNVLSNTYTPTLTNVANTDARTSAVCQYMRVGNVVTVSGIINIDDTTGATLTRVRVSLPIASDFATLTQCSGTCADTNNSGIIAADTTNNEAEIYYIAAGTSAHDLAIHFTYLIV